jgi:hypothetical protein
MYCHPRLQRKKLITRGICSRPELILAALSKGAAASSSTLFAVLEQRKLLHYYHIRPFKSGQIVAEQQVMGQRLSHGATWDRAQPAGQQGDDAQRCPQYGLKECVTNLDSSEKGCFLELSAPGLS